MIVDKISRISLNNSLRYIIFFLILLFGNSCDSGDEIPVITVNDESVIDDSQLQHIQQINNQAHQHKDKTTKDVLYFGFDLRASPQEDLAQYLPFLKYLQLTTGYQFKIHFTAKSSSAVEDLGNDTTQLAAMGATSFLEAQQKYDAVSLVRGLNKENKASYQSVFVTRPDSRITKIKQIRGKRLAFGSRDSTQGHLIPRIMLTDNNISLKDLQSYIYTGSHQNCAESVVSGKTDVCGMQDQLAKTLASRGLVKIIHSSAPYPSSGIVASKHLPEEMRISIKKALLDFDPIGKHNQGLYHWENTEMPLGFTQAKANDYDNLRHWSVKLGFLNPSQEQDKL